MKIQKYFNDEDVTNVSAAIDYSVALEAKSYDSFMEGTERVSQFTKDSNEL
jgi:hypothetical protein